MIRQKYKALVTIKFWVALLFGFIIAIVLIQPLAISIFVYDNAVGLISWWNTFKVVFKQIVEMGDSEQILKNFLFGLMGASITVMYYIGLYMSKERK